MKTMTLQRLRVLGLVIVAALWGNALFWGGFAAVQFGSNPAGALELWREIHGLRVFFSLAGIGSVLGAVVCYWFARQVLGHAIPSCGSVPPRRRRITKSEDR